MTAKKKKLLPVYLKVVKLADVETGEMVGAFVPFDEVAQGQLKHMKAKTGSIWRAELKKPRNVGFHRFAHKLGMVLKENIPELNACVDAHAVIKRLQVESETCCDVITYKFPGGTITRMEPQSLAFDSMLEVDFRALMKGLADHVAKTYWPTISGDPLAELMKMTERL